MVLKLSDIPRATLIRLGGGPEQECTAELFRQWLDECDGDPRDEAASTVGALCDAIRQIRNDYEYERGRADQLSSLLADLIAECERRLKEK